MDRQCGCVWRDERCTNDATQEDRLCNWCGNGRSVEQLIKDPKACVLPDGTFMGIGGAGQLHDSRPDWSGACWYPDSNRTVI